MNNYELMVVIKPDIGIDEIEKHLNDTKELITSHKGDVNFEDHWGTRDIAYKIKKYDRGFYAVLNFSADGGLVRELDSTLRLNNDVLRHLILNLPEGYKAKSYKQFEAEAEAADAEKAALEAAKTDVSKPSAPKTAKPVTMKKEEKTPEPKAKEEEKSSLEDVDAKLKSIIDNPDLNF